LRNFYILSTTIKDTSRSLLAEAAAELGILITEAQASAFRIYLDELNSWGEKINLLHRLDECEIILKDFIDSFTIMKYLSNGSSLLDLGSGAGFPGVPLKIIRKDLTVVLLDASRKKVFFLRNLIRALKIEGIKAFWTQDKDQLTKHMGNFDYVVSRAFGSIPKFLKEGLPFLKAGGTLLAMKGKRGEEELENIHPSLMTEGISLAFREIITLPILGHSRTILGFKLY
jgi:16S rRNA (guanine527-N7)-methyltransferase